MVRKSEIHGTTLKALPPYAPHSAWQQLMDGLRAGVPRRIDNSYFRKYRLNQATRSMLLNALRFLDLVDQGGYATEELKALVKVHGERYGQRLRMLVERSYGPLLADTDLATATPDLLQERFKAEGAKGDVARKCASFFVALAQDAGMPLSPHIRRRRRQPSGQSSVQVARKSPGASVSKQPVARESPPRATTLGDSSLPLAAVVTDKFPDFDPEWDKETVERWRESWGQLLKIVLQRDASPDR